jgi:hypothetical protein
MLLLVTSAHPTLQPHRTPSLGRLVQPRHFSSVQQTILSGMAWAADNDCFQGLSHRRYCPMLDRLQEALIAANDGERRGECWRGRPLFVTVPDAVADSRTTARLWGVWAHAVRRRGLPLAFVAQNGCDHPCMSPPWHEFDAVFIGGDTAWKLGPEARRIVRICKEHGKQVHMGRVNTQRRLRYAESIGVDSVDGTKWTKWRDTYLDEGLRFLDRVPAPPPNAHQLTLA